jgi:hypothetical protein
MLIDFNNQQQMNKARQQMQADQQYQRDMADPAKRPYTEPDEFKGICAAASSDPGTLRKQICQMR